jgi:hypothetical protein
MEDGAIDMTLLVARLTAVFCSVSAAAYVANHTEPLPAVQLLFSFAPLLAVILWLQKDAQRTGVGAVQDWGYFLLLAWPAVIPWYALKTRGPRGWRLAVGLFALILSAYVAGTGTWLIMEWFELGGS